MVRSSEEKKSGSNSNPLPHWALLSLQPLPRPEWQRRLWPLLVPAVEIQCFYSGTQDGRAEEGLII